MNKNRNENKYQLDRETRKRYLRLRRSFMNLSEYFRQISQKYDIAIALDEKIVPIIYILEHVPPQLALIMHLGSQTWEIMKEHGISTEDMTQDTIEIVVE